MTSYSVNANGDLVIFNDFDDALCDDSFYSTKRLAWQDYRERMIAKSQKTVEQLGVLMKEVDKAQEQMNATT